MIGIMISVAITYSAVSMEQITQAAETVETKQTADLQKIAEEFEIVSINTVGNKFNMTVSNRGDASVHITKLWVENTTDHTWPASKYELDYTIPSGGSLKNIGQYIDLTALDTQSYLMKLVTERGNTEKMFLNSIVDNSIGSDSVYLNLRATPDNIPTGFSTTLVLEVINTGSNKLFNLQAEMDAPVQNCLSSCQETEVSAVTPSSFDSLDPGDTVTFTWVYTITANDADDNITFTARLVGGIDEATAVVSVQPVEGAENSNVSLESEGLLENILVNDSVLLFHMEQASVPSPGYQMFSAEANGGSAGMVIPMDTHTLGTPFSAFTKNGSLSTIVIDEGTWTGSLALRSDALSPNISSDADLIFHFEDGDDNNPENSAGISVGALEGCNEIVLHKDTVLTDDYNPSANPTTINLSTANTGDLRIVTLTGTDQSADPMHTMTIPSGWTEINNNQEYGSYSAVRAATFYRIVQGGDASTVDVTWSSNSAITAISNTYSGFDASNPIDVEESSFATKNGQDPTSRSVTTTVENTMVVRTFHQDDASESSSVCPSGLTERGYNEIGDDGHNGAIVSSCETTQAGIGSTGTATWQTNDGEHNLVQTFAIRPLIGGSGNPDWQPNIGPHGSGAYFFDGVNECFSSIQDVSSGNGNDIEGNDVSTSLWFKVNDSPSVEEVTSEQMLVFWEGEGTYPDVDTYKISIGGPGDGLLLYEFDTNLGTGTTSCTSSSRYDDGEWYNVIGVRDESNDSCDLYIYDVSGTLLESIPDTKTGTGNNVNTDSGHKMYVGARSHTDSYFKGWIDDVIHWDSYELPSSPTDEVSYLSHTNYGDMAHQFEVNIEVTDEEGNNPVSILPSAVTVPIQFQDSKDQGINDDAAYTMFNFTLNSVPEIQVTSMQRLNFSMAFVDSTSTWEALHVDMKIDDEDFVDHFSSYIQIPYPSSQFPNYTIYDPDSEMILYIDNVGDDGIYFVYSGTRLVFGGDADSFASQIHYVNGTTAPFEVDSDSDSIYIPAGELAELRFYANPTDRPCQADGSNVVLCPNSNIIPDGSYSMSAWINGYTDQGESFGRSIIFGSVFVED